MKRRLLQCLLLLTVALSTGCAVSQNIDLVHIPTSAVQAENAYTVDVHVNDVRPYVVSGNKEQCFIGIYRAGFGNPWDVRTTNKTPLGDLVQKDLVNALRRAGFIVTKEAPERMITVDIKEYNFDCYVNCRVWHTVSVAVKDPAGGVLYTGEVANETTVQGSAMTGPKSAMEIRLPAIYGELIDKLVVQNPDAMKALAREQKGTALP